LAVWLLFLKYLDGLEQDRADESALGKLEEIGRIFVGFQKYLYLRPSEV